MPIQTIRLIPKRTAIIHLSWLGALLLFALVSIFPLQSSKNTLDEGKKDIQQRIEEQKNLKPIYQALKQKSQSPVESVLPTPASGKLSRTLVGSIPATIRRISRTASLNTVSVIPDVNSLATTSGRLAVQAVLRGDFMNLRRFLIAIGALPYLERIEQLEIVQDPDFMEFRIKFWLNVG